jgi:predicted RNase H-like HicB family nuclease
MMMNKYETIIYWSEADEVYIAEMPELTGCISHGDSPDEALKNIQALAQEWLELAKEKKWQIPRPKGRLIFA